MLVKGDIGIKRKPPCIGGMELVSLCCNRAFISAESVLCMNTELVYMYTHVCKNYILSQCLISAWRSNIIHYKVWDEITYPFPNPKVDR